MGQIKLHIGCGTVYLKNYINIHPAPDKVTGKFSKGIICSKKDFDINTTDVDNYYKSEWSERPKYAIADLTASLFQIRSRLPLSLMSHSNFADEVCMFHVLEHIPKYELDESIKHIYDLLKPGGIFRVAVPDFDAITIEFADKLRAGISEEEKEWYYRYVYGTQKDKWSHHYCGYNRYRLVELLKKFGFDDAEDLPNQNFYPAIHLLIKKV